MQETAEKMESMELLVDPKQSGTAGYGAGKDRKYQGYGAGGV